VRPLLVTTERGWRGGEVQLGLLATELVARGHRPSVAAPPGAAILERLPGAVERVELAARNDLDLVAAAKLGLAARRLKPELVHAFTPRAQAVARLGLRGTPPLVASKLTGFAAGKGLGGHLKYRGVARYAAVSRAAAEALRRAGVPEERVRLIPSAVGPAFRLRPSAPGTDVIGCVAALVPGKGHDALIEAVALLARALPSLELRLVGDGPERAALSARAQRLGVGGRVRFLGALRSPEEVAGALAALDLFVLASHAEGLPTALLEAMAVGVPVVATPVGGVPEIVRDGETGKLVPVGDPAALATAIADLLADGPGRARLAQAARTVAEAHSIARVAGLVEALYAEVVR
jgi:glycosyltransferase involved in cell wall biosynthesis